MMEALPNTSDNQSEVNILAANDFDKLSELLNKPFRVLNSIQLYVCIGSCPIVQSAKTNQERTLNVYLLPTCPICL